MLPLTRDARHLMKSRGTQQVRSATLCVVLPEAVCDKAESNYSAVQL
jgi:hypothetical protein